MKKYAISDKAGKKEALEGIAILAHKNKLNENVIRIYVSLFSSNGEYKEAIKVLESLNKESPASALLLQECMLKDRIHHHDLACYKKALSIAENKGVRNTDHLIVLYFSGDKRFNEEKEKYLSHNSNDSIISIFDKERDAVLKEIYPN
ncbi:hypothetical protein COO59_11400 [Mixta theicola]|uniref:Tetratricopeptide repeat protein n=2 Tax=Mixta theicola TaxID=1458355 RepID=A0A2K1Q9B5_9GAMM|nr:hypothetical protein COO59_11400 [Mixta theicola]